MKIKTACPLDCWDVCSIIAEVEDGVIKKLVGNPHHPITQGFLCGKGRGLKDRQASENRLLYPLKKVDGHWQTIAWDQAYTEISEKLQQAIANSGHHSILHVFDWGTGAVLKNLNQRFFYLMGGCSETVGSLCWDAGLEAQRYDFGEARSHAAHDLVNASAVVVWGRNVANTNIHMMPFLKAAQANGAQIVIVNPLPTDLDGRATLCITPRPGSDGALALGVLRVCRDEGWLDEEFLTHHSVGWENLSVYLDGFDAKTVERLTDVPKENIVRLAEIYGQGRVVSTLLGIGMQRYPGGGNAIRSIDALAGATGHIGKSGGGVQYANREMLAYLNQECLTERSGKNIREFTRGGQASEIMNANPPVEVMIINRTNPVTQVPDTEALQQAYATVPCKVVIDMFMTPTAELADYVLPCTSVLEEEDFTFSTMWHSIVSYIAPVLPAKGESKPDWEIFADLAHRLGFGELMRKPINEWLQMVLNPLVAEGLDLAHLMEKGWLEIPHPPVSWSDFKFKTPTRKFEFYSETAVHDGQSGHAVFIPSHETSKIGKFDKNNDEFMHSYPYALLTVHPRLSQNSQHRDAPDLPLLPIADVSQEIALERDLRDGDEAVIWNDKAQLHVQIRLTQRGHPQTVKIESGWWGQGLTINHFTKTYRADFGQQTAQYDCTCDIRKFKKEAQ